uniref:Uncharacterized protein n=1 Tax=Lepeophtheirus salmonis TaxID=72036 RepID=A0A0K2TL84_LEPSM
MSDLFLTGIGIPPGFNSFPEYPLIEQSVILKKKYINVRNIYLYCPTMSEVTL